MVEYWHEAVKGEQFIVSKGEDLPFQGDDGHPYEIIVQKYEDGSIGTTIHDLAEDRYDPVKLPDYVREAERRWKDE